MVVVSRSMAVSTRAARRRVLVVDDNVDITSCLHDLLALLGHEVHEANTGSRALALAAEHGPDLVLLDLSLPDLDGYEVVRGLRAMPAGVAMEIVALSGSRLDPSREGRFDRHILKPIDLADLRAILASRDPAR